METITTTTNPSGVQTTTIKRPVMDPFDVALAQEATRLMQGGFAP